MAERVRSSEPGASIVIEHGAGDDDIGLRETAVSDLPLERGGDDVPPEGAVIDDRYQILGLLGEGGMGHVLSAKHVVLGHRVAIKVLRREMTRDEEIVERFRREARAASAIGHAGIVAVKDFGTLANGASYFVMEHVEGESLADAIAQDRPFDVARAVAIVRQIADALGAAHAAGIVHRDVKPENVLLTSFHGRPDHVKVLDFGIAKLDFASRLSGAHRVLGTPAYMSPEQARGRGLDQRTDVYSLGVVLFELLVGDVPFDDAMPVEVLRKQIADVPPRVSALRPEVPEALADVIASCLAKSPDERPSTMQELAERLLPFAPRAAERPSPAPVASTPRRSSEASAPVVLELPPPVVGRATPVRVASSRPRIGAVALAGLALILFGVVALAAAGGLLFGADRGAATAAAPPATIAPAASIAAPTPSVAVVPAEVAAPAVAEVAPAPVTAAAPALGLARPLPPHRPLHAAPSSSPPDVSPAPAPAPAPEAHPAIQVIDPWE